MTFTGAIGAVCMFPLRLIISASVALGIHPNTLTLIGVLINVVAAWALAQDRFVLAGVIMIVANIFDFIDGKVAHLTGKQSQFGAFWDSTLDRFSDLALFTGLIWLYSTARARGLCPDRDADAHLLDHDQLRAGARRVAHRKVQGRIHGTAGAHRALHDRRLHRSDGRRAAGDPGALDRHRRQPDLLHLSSRSTGCRCRRPRGPSASSGASSSGATNGRRCPTTCG